MVKPAMVPLTCRIPADLAAALNVRAERDDKDRSEVIRAALAAYLDVSDTIEERLIALERAVAQLRADIA